jgi:hypothetical protein
MNYNEYMAYKNLWDSANLCSRESIALHVHTREEKMHKIGNSSVYLRTLWEESENNNGSQQSEKLILWKH